MFERFKERREEKRLTRMQEDLEKLNKRLQFNPNKMVRLSNSDEERKFTQKIQEYKVLSSGDAKTIFDFYKATANENQLNYFWKSVDENYLKVHAGFPKLIADKMATLIAGEPIDISLEVYDDNQLNDALTADANELVNALKEQTNFQEKISQMAFIDAVYGHDVVKFNYDLAVSQYPIIEVHDLTNTEVIKRRGITKAIIFKDWIDYKDKHYRFDETYTTNEQGFAIIKNALYLLKATGDTAQVPLDSIPHTAYLKEYRKEDPNNPLTYIQEFEGVQGMLAFEKPNKLPNTEFNVPYGRSDISQTDLSDKLDEIASEIAGEVRNNKTVSYIPSTLLPRDENGEPLKWNPFITRYQKINGSLDQNADNRITTDIIVDKTVSHVEKAKIYMDLLCASCGLSPLTLGITSFEAVGANVSGEGFRERIKTTLETRSKKVELFKPYLQNIIRQLLAFNHFLVTKAGAKQPGLKTSDINFDNCNVLVDFSDYVGTTERETLDKVVVAKSAGLMSLEQAIYTLYPNWSEEQRMEEVNRIKVENNIALDTPDLLQFDLNEGLTNEEGTEDTN